MPGLHGLARKGCSLKRQHLLHEAKAVWPRAGSIGKPSNGSYRSVAPETTHEVRTHSTETFSPHRRRQPSLPCEGQHIEQVPDSFSPFWIAGWAQMEGARETPTPFPGVSGIEGHW